MGRIEITESILEYSTQFKNSSIHQRFTGCGPRFFCLQNPVRPFYPRALLKRFITQLASSDSLIYDIFDGPNRAAVSVLLDKVKNPSGSANLEIIGWNKEVQANELFSFVFSNLPTGRPVQAGTHETIRPSAKILENFGFEFLYHTFEMKKADMIIPVTQNNNEVRFERLSLKTFDEYYRLLVKSFEANLEASISPLEEMKKTFEIWLNENKTAPILLKLDEGIVGFSCPVQDETDSKDGEVHTIGILPEFRGKGLGTVALSKAITELSNLGCERCHLTVASKNQSALSLYKKFGFNVEQTYTSYLRK